MKSRLQVTLFTIALMWMFLFVISGCGASMVNAPVAETTQGPTVPMTAIFVPPVDGEDGISVVAVLDPELLANAIPVLLSTPTPNEVARGEALDTSLALIDAMTWSMYRPIPNFSTSPEWRIPGLSVTTQEAATVLNLPNGVDSSEIAVGMQNYISNRFVGGDSLIRTETPTPCPGATRISSSELKIDSLPETSTYVIPFMFDYSRIQNALSSANGAMSEDLLSMAGPYVATEIDPAKVVFEANPFYDQDSDHSRIVFIATDRESLSLLDPPPDVILDPAREITHTLPDNQSAPMVIHTSEEFRSWYFGICQECGIPKPAPAPSCMIAQ